jgi:hypothetical protein
MEMTSPYMNRTAIWPDRFLLWFDLRERLSPEVGAEVERAFQYQVDTFLNIKRVIDSEVGKET